MLEVLNNVFPEHQVRFLDTVGDVLHLWIVLFRKIVFNKYLRPETDFMINNILIILVLRNNQTIEIEGEWLQFHFTALPNTHD